MCANKRYNNSKLISKSECGFIIIVEFIYLFVEMMLNEKEK